MNKKKLLYNTITSVILQIITIVCGFIIPRLLLKSFGSETNGLVNSISNFLGFITVLEMGFGSVIPSALYKPLADNDKQKISEIMTSADNYFKLLARLFLGYVIILVFVYPTLISTHYTHLYVSSLIITISLNLICNYYFGITNRLLLQADQRIYISNIVRILILTISTIVSYIMLKMNFDILAVKIAGSLIGIFHPFVLHCYVKKHYQIAKVSTENNVLDQKWYGFAQHISCFVFANTDVFLLTVFSTLYNVSIYNIYHLVLTGIESLVNSIMPGFQPILGNEWAKQNTAKLNYIFEFYIWLYHTISTLAFSCTLILIVPFVMVFTKGVNDTNYAVYTFAVLITISRFIFCLKTPYHDMIFAANHYKQTQSYFVFATAINLLVSALAVKKYSLNGVAIGTIIGCLYQLIWMIVYNTKFLKTITCFKTSKQIIIDIVLFGITLVYYFNAKNQICSTYYSWFLYAIKTFAIVFIFITIVNYICYNDKIKIITKQLKTKADFS